MLDLIDAYVVHQENVLIKATQFDKEKAEKRAEILEGLIIASDNIDKVIHIIRNATDKNDAAEKLKQNFQILTEEQIKAILNMKLSSLTKMDKHELEKELEEKKAIIKRCGEILESKELRDSIIIEKVEWLRDKYGDERRTTYNNSFYSEKDEVEYIPEKCILTLYDNMTFKRTPVTNLKVQKRKGKGVKSTDGTILSTIETNTTDRVLMFTRAGKMYQAKVGELAENKIIRATSLVNLDAGDEIVSITSFNKETKCDYICFTTSKGMFKKSLLGEYNTNKKAGIKAISFKDDDDFLVDVSFVVDENVIMFSDNGKCICFNTDLVNPIGRSAKGVVAMKLEEGERIISVVYPREGDQYICLTNKRGYSKKIKIEDFNVQNRGGKGVKYYSFDFLSAIVVNDGDLIVAQGEPNSITIKSEDIVVTSKTARGTQIIKDSILTEITKIESED
jgi:DNA gyrase subunit A